MAHLHGAALQFQIARLDHGAFHSVGRCEKMGPGGRRTVALRSVHSRGVGAILIW